MDYVCKHGAKLAIEAVGKYGKCIHLMLLYYAMKVQFLDLVFCLILVSPMNIIIKQPWLIPLRGNQLMAIHSMVLTMGLLITPTISMTK